jgi:hypothetical protein
VVSHRVGKLGVRNRAGHTVIPCVWGGGNLDPHLAAKIRKMNEYQRIFIDKLINDILFKGLLEQLTPSTQILNNSPQLWLQFQQQFSAGAPRSPQNWSYSSSSAPVSEYSRLHRSL